MIVLSPVLRRIGNSMDTHALTLTYGHFTENGAMCIDESVIKRVLEREVYSFR